MATVTVTNEGNRTIVVGKTTVAPGAKDVDVDVDAFTVLVENGPAGKALAADLKQKAGRKKTASKTDDSDEPKE